MCMHQAAEATDLQLLKLCWVPAGCPVSLCHTEVPDLNCMRDSAPGASTVLPLGGLVHPSCAL